MYNIQFIQHRQFLICSCAWKIILQSVYVQEDLIHFEEIAGLGKPTIASD